jgi:plasmid stability protein
MRRAARIDFWNEEEAMGTITVRNLPEDLIERIKGTAEMNGRSMEEEVRRTLAHEYRSNREILQRLKERAAQMDAEWKAMGKKIMTEEEALEMIRDSKADMDRKYDRHFPPTDPPKKKRRRS